MQISRLPHNYVFQQSARYVLVFVATTGIMVGWLLWSISHLVQDQRDTVIRAEIQGLDEIYRREGLDGLVAVVRGRSADREAVYLLVDAQLLALAGNLGAWPSEPTHHGGWVDFRSIGSDGGEHAIRAHVFTLRGGFRLLVGRDDADIDRLLASLREYAVLTGLAAVAIGLASGWWMARTVARRIDAIDTTAREIRDGDLRRRIPLRGSGDEFDRLSDNLNQMLGRIQSLMEGVRHVGNSLAHDMRQPLTRLRNHLEQLATALVEVPHAQSEVQACLEEADRVLATFSAMLRIARIEAGAVVRPQTAVDLAVLVADAVELYAELADEREVAFSVDATPASLAGDRDLLFQMLVNLLDNALKWAPHGSSIGIRVSTDGAVASILIDDRGPGIPAPERARVFERFYRVDESRGTPGSGLGLALVKSVLDMHRGSIVLEDNAPGLRVGIRIPVHADSIGAEHWSSYDTIAGRHGHP